MKRVLEFLQKHGNLARVARLPLKAIPKNSVVPIMRGPCRGMKWVSGSGRISFWLGTYEADKLAVLASRVRPGMVFYDIGANLGVYTLAAARRGAVVHSFEPMPHNMQVLRRHVQLNGLGNVTPWEVAVGGQTGVATFKLHHQDNSMGRLSSDGDLKVRCVRLDDLDIPAPNCLKMDIEGAEAEALAGARNMLQRRRPLIFLATHGEIVRERCLALLKDLGYQVSNIDASGDEFIAEP